MEIQGEVQSPRPEVVVVPEATDREVDVRESPRPEVVIDPNAAASTEIREPESPSREVVEDQNATTTMIGTTVCESPSRRVVVVQDAAREVNMHVLRWIPDGFVLKAGEGVTLISVLHQINHPLGYKTTMDGSIFGATQEIVKDEISRKKKEYLNNSGLVKISKLYKTKTIDFKIEFVAGPIPKKAALEAVLNSNATWVILDRRMKEEKNYFLAKLSCGISKMQRNSNVEKIRGPKRPLEKAKTSVEGKLPTEVADREDDTFSIELTSSSTCTSSTAASSRTSISEGGKITPCNGTNTEEKIKTRLQELATLLEEYGNNSQGLERSPMRSETISGQVQTPPPPPPPPPPVEKVQLDHKICSTCKSTRPTSAWKMRVFSYLELTDTTNRFSSENMIYRGEHEAVFRGTLKSCKLDVVVKEQKDVKKYKSEIQALEKTRHENLIMLLGTCLEKGPRLLVFEYACNGSLEQHLSNQRSRPLTWEERLKIAVGGSRGLNHLHKNSIIHGDMRPKNILLTHDFEPLISGFGLARMNTDSNKCTEHFVLGAFGYLAPEYTERGKATTKTDVYAFGVVLLELITGRSTKDTRLNGKSILKWAKPLIRGKRLSEVAEPGLVYDNHQFMATAEVALNCLCKDPHIRLSMDEIMSTLEYIKDEKRNEENPNTKGSIAHSCETLKANGHVENHGLQHIRQPSDDKDDMYLSPTMTPVPKQAKYYYFPKQAKDYYQFGKR